MSGGRDCIPADEAAEVPMNGPKERMALRMGVAGSGRFN